MSAACGPDRRVVAVLNPNTSVATTEAMRAAIEEELGADDGLDGLHRLVVRGYTASRGAPMILDPAALAVGAAEVVVLARQAMADAGPALAGLVVGAFGDPGVDEVRGALETPVVGLAEAGVRRAASDGRRFGIATTTPRLADAITTRIVRLGLDGQFTGFRFTAGDPVDLTGDPRRLAEALAAAVRESIDHDGADNVVIGGGPLSSAAQSLAAELGEQIVVPVVEAARSLRSGLEIRG